MFLAHFSGKTCTTFLPNNINLIRQKLQNLKVQQPHRCTGIFVSCFLPCEQRQALPCVVLRISACALTLHPSAGPGACQFCPLYPPCCPPLGDTCGKCMVPALTPPGLPFSSTQWGPPSHPPPLQERERTEQGKPCGTPEGDIHGSSPYQELFAL